MIVGWKGQTWGEGDTVIESAQGLEDFIAAAANVTGGRNGGIAAPLFRPVGGWVLGLRVLASSDVDMDAKLNAIYAVTAGPDDGLEEDPFTFTMPGSAVAKTIYARVVARQPATDFTTAGRLKAATVPITYEGNDPTVYGPEVEATLALGTPHNFTPGGWKPTMRWRWIAHGPLVLPRLTITAAGMTDRVLRLGGNGGHLNTGQSLVWDSTPNDLVATVGGPSFDRYGDFDGGVHTIDPPDITLGTGAQTVTMSASSGSGDGLFRYRPAMP